MDIKRTEKAAFIPHFQKSFLLPKYWGIWLGMGIAFFTVYLTLPLRNAFLTLVGYIFGQFSTSARRRARINLLYCFPELTEAQRNKIVNDMFICAIQSLLLVAEIVFRGPQRVLQRTRWHGFEHLEALRQSGENVIILVPHGWAVDTPAILLSAQGQAVAGMFHNQKNPLIDWLWNKARVSCGGRLHARNGGIKPFVNSIRQGYWGYYLPDQDHGGENSQFVNFFATYKATLPSIGRLKKLCRAKVIPLFPVYDSKSGILNIYIQSEMGDIHNMNEYTMACRMNKEVEQLVRPYPAHYTWILKLLKTRKQGEIEPYERKDLYP